MIHIDNPKTFLDIEARYKDTASRHRHFLHSHATYEICFFLDVSQVNLEIFIKDAKYEINNGDIIFINEFDVHRFIFNTDEETYNRYVINFKKEFIYPYMSSLGVTGIFKDLDRYGVGKLPTTVKERAKMEGLFDMLVKAAKNNDKNKSDAVKQAAAKSALILCLTQIWELAKKPRLQNKFDKNEILVQRLIQFIDENYMYNISLDELADNFFINKYYMCKIFKDITDVSIMEYTQQRRIISAQKLLRNDENKKVIDICFDCGFNNTQHFHRTFKKVTGITPHKYRSLWT